MSRSLYVSAVEAGSGKSLISLGLAELLARRAERPAFFRPVIRDSTQVDNDTELMRQRYCPQLDYQSMYAVTHETARDLYANDRYQELLKRVLNRYMDLEKECDFVLCEGTDFTLSSAFELDFNARLANHLGCPVLVVVSGVDKTRDTLLDAVLAAREGFENEGCTIAAVIANRVAPELCEFLAGELQAEWPHPEPVYVLPEHELLGRPTIGEIRTALNADMLLGSELSLDREALSIKIAAMQLPNFLEHITPGSLIITPGDRGDVLLASLAMVHSKNYPPIAGVLLTGGLQPAESIIRLLDGLKHVEVPVLMVADDTFQAADKVSNIRAAIAPSNDRKIAAALGVFESGVNCQELEQRIDVVRPSVVTPLMFEHQLIERAKLDRQHVVLPEGTDDRILRHRDSPET